MRRERRLRRMARAMCTSGDLPARAGKTSSRTPMNPLPSPSTLPARLRAAHWGSPICAFMICLLAACGGGGGGDSAGPPPVVAPPVIEKPATVSEASRFLTQATFGPVQSDIDRVMSIGYGPWIDEQLAKPASGSHRANWEAVDAAIKAADATRSAGQDDVLNSFWKGAVTGDDQLRQRVAFALSQIFVISMQGSNCGRQPARGGGLPRHARRQGARHLPRVAAVGVAAPDDGHLPVAPAQPEGRSAHRPRAGRELRTRSDAAVLDRPA